MRAIRTPSTLVQALNPILLVQDAQSMRSTVGAAATIHNCQHSLAQCSVRRFDQGFKDEVALVVGADSGASAGSETRHCS